MICLTCSTPLLSLTTHKRLSADRKHFQLNVPCTACGAIWSIEQKELREADPDRLKDFKSMQDSRRVSYCPKCTQTVVVGKEAEHRCPAPLELPHAVGITPV